MPLITSIKNINYMNYAQKAYNKILNSKTVNKFVPDNPTDLAVTLAIASTALKDTVNCYYYTTQSLKNEKIPEEKRKFVAALDLANGIMNVAVAAPLGKMAGNLAGTFFDNHIVTDKRFGADAVNKLQNKFQSLDIKNFDAGEIVKGLEKGKKFGKAGFGVIVGLVISQIFCKRVITPFFATPLAGVFKNQMEQYDNRKAAKNIDSLPQSTLQNQVNPLTLQGNNPAIEVQSHDTNLLHKFHKVG